MSRSRKKTPCWTCKDHEYMNLANRSVRKRKLSEELIDGKNYRKFSSVNAYDICDCKSCFYTKKEIKYYIDLGWYKEYECYMK